MRSTGALRFFDAIARRYDRVYALRGAASKQRLSRALAELPPASRVLCLGVGTGRELSPLLDLGHAPTGLDFSEKMLALCNERARKVPLVRADFWAEIPLPDASFDAAIALHGTLCHPPDGESRARLARELGRVIRPGGVFVAEVPTPAFCSQLPLEPPFDDDGLRVRRIDDARCVHEDRIANCSIEVRVASTEEWTRALAAFDVRVEPLGDAEILIVGRR